MVWSLVYVALRRVLGLVVLRGRSQRAKDLELIMLRHETMSPDVAAAMVAFLVSDEAGTLRGAWLPVFGSV